jgi:hypothetical protein
MTIWRSYVHRMRKTLGSMRSNCGSGSRSALIKLIGRLSSEGGKRKGKGLMRLLGRGIGSAWKASSGLSVSVPRRSANTKRKWIGDTVTSVSKKYPVGAKVRFKDGTPLATLEDPTGTVVGHNSEGATYPVVVHIANGDRPCDMDCKVSELVIQETSD